MAPNLDPIYPRLPNRGAVRITAANTSSSGAGTIGTDIFLAFTAGTEGAYVSLLRLMPTATTPTTTTATVARVFVSTKDSGATLATDTFLWAEVTLAAVGADNASSAVNPIDVVLNFALAPGDTILVTNHAAPAANTAWVAQVIGGNY